MNRSILNQTVSVIIPVLNAEKKLQKVLEALSVQTYPNESVAVIVVDNGSEDKTVQIAKQFDVNILTEKKPGPYAARNKGLKEAEGKILALLDAGTVPEPQWIEEGVKCINENNADLVGGNIIFDLGTHATSGEIYDAITFADNRKFIEEEGAAAAGNLFFKKKVWLENGEFPEQRTGMDIWWTNKAVKNGFKLVFSEEAVVYYQPRKWIKTIQKSFRVGTMHPYNMRSSGRSFTYILWHTIRCFFPKNPREIWQKMDRLNQSFSSIDFFKVWVLACVNKAFMGFGRVRGLLRLRKLA